MENDKNLNVRIPRELNERVKAVADKVGVSISQLVRMHLVDLAENGVNQAARLEAIEKRLAEIERKLDEMKNN